MQNRLENFINELFSYENEIISKLEESSISLENLPELLITHNVVINAIVKNVENFRKLPLFRQDNFACLAACQISPSLLAEIPSERSAWVNSNIKTPILKFFDDVLKTKNICIKFIEINYHNVVYLPQVLTADRAFIEYLCGVNPYILRALDDGLIDRELCDIAIQSSSFSLDCLPEKWRDKESCDKAFAKNYRELVGFPKDLVAYHYVYSALQQCKQDEAKQLISLLVADEWDEHLILEAIKKDSSILSAVPTEKITYELMFKLADFIARYEHLYHVPESIFNANLAYKLVMANPLLLGGVPVEFRDRVLCLKAVAIDGMALQFAPKITQTDEMYHVAVANNGLALRHVPQPYRDDTIPSVAIKQNGEAIKYLPDYSINEVLCREAVLQNPHAIFSIPKQYQSRELYDLAIKTIPQVLKLIPQDSRTVDQCIKAIEAKKDLFDYVPLSVRENSRFVAIAESLGLMKRIEDYN
ncbi:hypothetical protein [Acinetobacter sp. P1(2025)]|uniref:hypothetical protein n=1 Tax=Acinetobacter sp. P1(2025) TaxID=3446120 RepID=UPI003F52EECB